MLRKLLILGVCAGTSAAVPIVFQNNRDAVYSLMQGAAQADAPAQGAALLSTAPGAASPAGRPTGTPVGRKVVIPADARGHFVAEFRVNGRRVPAMVDTGATVVALSRSTARGLGMTLVASDFKYKVDTANGQARAASVTIPSVDIGRIRVENVEGVVLEDGALGQTLIGMSFLKQLDGYQVEDGSLLLSQ